MEVKRTIFEEIIDGENPSKKVYEDSEFLAFLDIAPVEYGHTLLIPKKRYVWMQDVPDELIAEIFIKTKELMLAIKKGLKCDYVQVGIAGDEVPYFHIHIIPRYRDKKNEGRASYESSEQMTTYAKKISKAL
jgi:histidine triad (HIT) family protein